jgi:alpha-1,3-rhamnosyltransferase
MPVMPNLVSVLCVSYNQAAYSAAALRSVFDQSYRDLELVIVDDGSTDGNPDVIRETLNDSPFPARFIEQANTANVPGNFNTALRESTGRFVTFLSLDDLLLPDCIDRKLAVMQADDSITFVADRTNREIDPQGATITEQAPMPIDDDAIQTADDLLDVEYANAHSFYIQGQLFRRDAIDAIGGFDDTLTGDDIILRTRLFRHLAAHPEKTFALLPGPGFAYRKHGDNLHRNSFRQVKTLVEWHGAFFADRPAPEVLLKLLDSYFEELLASGNQSALDAACAYHPLVAQRLQDYRTSWKGRRRAIKRGMRKLLSKP